MEAKKTTRKVPIDEYHNSSQRSIPRTPSPELAGPEMGHEAEQNASHLRSKLSRDSQRQNDSQLFFGESAKGYYDLKRMHGRSKYNYLSAALQSVNDPPTDSVLATQPLPSMNMIKFDKQLARYQEKKKKNAISTPFYNPNFEFIQRKITVGVPIFEKQSARKEPHLARNCLNEYDINDVDRGQHALEPSKPVPRFDAMCGRETLDKFKTVH